MGTDERKRVARLLSMVVAAVVVTSVMASVLVTTPAAPAPPRRPELAPKAGAYVFTLRFDGLTRDFRLHVPPAASSGRPLPLVLNLHGATQNGQLEEITSDMDPNADQNGYLAAYPDGTRISKVLTPDPVAKQAQYGWNAGMCCGLPVTRHIDDVGFLLEVIAGIAARTPVDLRRVYVTGISNGGMMAYAMAAEASGHVAAVSSVSGQVELPTIQPSRAVPTMEFHSVDDPIAKWVGVPNRDPRLRLSVMEGIDQWVRTDECDPSPHVGPTLVGATGSISAGQTATPVTYTDCLPGSEVALWRFTGSGHVWPGSTLNTGPPSNWILAGVGRGIVLVDADEVMWQFFRRFSLPAPPPFPFIDTAFGFPGIPGTLLSPV
ncbi:MAG: PHB depolymerase family esterase [Acidimicrobiales bacterium]|jgi:polyhydroxybutyrate depolymerase